MRRAIAITLVLLGALWAHGAGPLIVNGAGTPLVWTTQPIPFNPDLGTLGMLSNAEAVDLVAQSFDVWAGVGSAAIAFTNAGALPVDVQLGNYTQFLDQCDDGRSPIVFDTDGSITEDMLGAGASNEVLGFAGPECGDVATATITEGVAVLNGRFVDGVQSPTNPEVPVDEFKAVFIHEFGHYLDLDHSQIGLAEAFDGDPGNDDAVATMFPILIDGNEAATLALDDVVSVSSLYPGPAFASGNGTITGQVLRASGMPFQGAYVIARNLLDPRLTAVGFTSGARHVPILGGQANPGGPPSPALLGAFELPGLPPGDYTVEIEPIDPDFTGGSSVGPLDPPAELPGPAEFWNGANESAANPPDDPPLATPIAVAAGQVVTGIDVRLNEVPPANDACAAAVVVAPLPFVDTRSVASGTTAPDDPAQSCTTFGASQNLASVWYAFTAPQTGRFVIDTAGSTYDTVVTAHTGACGSLVEVACSDDTDTASEARAELDLDQGATVLIEVTAFHDSAPGTLRLAVSRGCATPCEDGDVCSVADACDDAGMCVPGPRIDAPTLAIGLQAALPDACATVSGPRPRNLQRRLARAGQQVARAAARTGGTRRRAFAAASRLLRAARRLARRIGRKAPECGAALEADIATARAQLDCVRGDLGAARR